MATAHKALFGPKNDLMSEVVPLEFIQKAIILVESLESRKVSIKDSVATRNRIYHPVDLNLTEYTVKANYLIENSEEVHTKTFTVKRELKSSQVMNKGLLEKELSVYNILFQEFQNQSPQSKFKVPSKRQIFLSKGPQVNLNSWNPVVLMEDSGEFRYLFLRNDDVEDFVPVADETKVLDFNHSLAALDTLARFHANSYFLKKKMARLQGKTSVSSMQILNKFPFGQESMFTANNSRIISKVYEECYELVCKVVEMENPSLGMKLRRKIQGGAIFDKLIALLENEKYENTDLYVFCHGNFSINNLLFKYDNSTAAFNTEREPLDCKIVNYEFLRYAPLASDLTYFFSCCSDGSLKRDFQEKLLAHYCDTFENELVEKLGFPQDEFDIEDFHRKVEEQFYGRMMEFGFLCSCLILPLITLNNSSNTKYWSINENNFAEIINEIKERLTKDHKIQSRIMENVKQVTKTGLL